MKRRTRSIAVVGALATAGLTLVVPAAQADAAPAPAKLQAAGRYTVGKPLALTGTCSSKATSATVVGPRSMRAKLTRSGTTGPMTGAITVPKQLKGSWVRLRMTCSDGAQATTIIAKVGAKGTIPTR